MSIHVSSLRAIAMSACTGSLVGAVAICGNLMTTTRDMGWSPRASGLFGAQCCGRRPFCGWLYHPWLAS